MLPIDAKICVSVQSHISVNLKAKPAYLSACVKSLLLCTHAKQQFSSNCHDNSKSTQFFLPISCRHECVSSCHKELESKNRWRERLLCLLRRFDKSSPESVVSLVVRNKQMGNSCEGKCQATRVVRSCTKAGKSPRKLSLCLSLHVCAVCHIKCHPKPVRDCEWIIPIII